MAPDPKHKPKPPSWKPARSGRTKKRPLRPAIVEGFTHADWKTAIANRPGKCAVCGEVCGAYQPHHVVYAQWITGLVTETAKRTGMSRDDTAALLARLLYDPRNGMKVGYDCHRRHHNRSRPIRRDLLPAPALEFAAELGLLHRVERAYP